MEPMLTFLVVDQVGSTEQIQRLGDQRAAEIRAVLLDITGSAVASWGGSIYHYTGDGLMASFGDADAATGAAAAMQFGAAEYTEAQVPGEEITLRIGIHSGLPVITAEGHFIGIDCHIAARLCSVATQSSILISDRTESQIDPDTPRASIGRVALKGIPDPPELFVVHWLERPLPTAPFAGSSAPVPAPVGGRSLELGAALVDMPPSPLIVRSTLRSGTFVGREREYNGLREAWARTAAGERSVVLLSGSAGFGKSSLASGFADTDVASSGVLLAGRCDEFAASSYEPFTESLRHLVQNVPIGVLTEHASIYGEVLTVLVPELGSRLGIEFGAVDVDDSSADRLFDAVVDLLARVSRARPAFLLIEDLHWASEPTVRLLRHIVRDPHLSHVMIVATMRADDLGIDTAPLIHDMQREVGVELLEMQPLSVPEVSTLITSMIDGLDNSHTADLAVHIVEDTGGTPFFVREVIRHIRETYPPGQLPRLDQGQPLPLPDGVIEVIHRRADHLGSHIRGVLEFAAIIGTEFDLRILEAIADADDDQIADVMDAAEAAHLVIAGHGPQETYRFAHDLYRTALSESFGAARRRRIHGRVADAIIELVGLTGATAADILRHLVAAGRPEAIGLAMTAADRAAESATSSFAYPDAVRYQSTALTISRLWAESDVVLHATREIALGAALNRAGRSIDAGDHFWVGAQLARTIHRTDLLCAAALGYGGELPTTPPPDKRAIELLEEVLSLPDVAVAAAARSSARLAEWCHTTKPFSERTELCDRAAQLARSIDDPLVLGRVLVSRARALHGPASVSDNLDLGEEIRGIGEATGSDDLRFHAASVICTSAWESSDLQRASDETDLAHHLSAGLHHVAYTRNGLMWTAMLATAAGDWARADRDVATLNELLGSNQHLHSGLIQSAIALPKLWFQGDARIIHDLVSSMPAHDFIGMSAGYAAEAGLLEEASQHVLDFGPVDRIAELANYNFWHLSFALTIAASELDDRVLAASLYDIVAPFADHNALMGTVAFLGVGHHHLGILAATLGELDEADARFDRAIERHRELEFPPWIALSQIERARVLDRLGGHSRANEIAALVADASDTAERLGLGAVTRRVGRLISPPAN